MNYLWDLLEDPTCEPPKDCLYYYPGQRLTRGNGHHQESNIDEIPVFTDLPRYGRPLPIALSAKDTLIDRLLARKESMISDVYAESIGDPAAPAVFTIDTVDDSRFLPQSDGNYESKQVRIFSDYAEDSHKMLKGLKSRRLRLSGPMVFSPPEFRATKDKDEEAFTEFGIEFFARMLQNPKYLFEMIKYVDQEERGTLDTGDFVKLIFNVAE